MAFNFATAQIIAFLFAGGGVAVSVEDSPPPHGFQLENSESGAAALVRHLVPLRDMTREPLFCIGMAPGTNIEGVLAEELLSAPVRRFLMAQERYEAFAKRDVLDPTEAQTLVRACRDQFSKQ